MEILTFFTQFAKYPGMVGSIVPSSRFLTKRMLSPIDWNDARVVIELGCGTGVITKEIMRHYQDQAQVFLFEKNDHFRSLLSQRYPHLSIYEDAQTLDQVLQSKNQQADVIISSLPFSNFSDKKQESILQAVQRGLKDHGLFITYQYSLQMKRKLELCFSNMSVHQEWINIPPAWVYICTK